jgi:hypothetical protein
LCRIDILDDSGYNRFMMSTETTVEVAGHHLPVVIERVNGCYQATSPALYGFLVLADTLDELLALALAPGVTHVLLDAKRSKGKTATTPNEETQLPS